MHSALTALHQFVERQYTALGDATLLTSHSTSVDPTERPLWQWQNAELKSVQDARSATGAVILDAEIGLCLFAQLFGRDTDVRSQIARALSIRSELIPNRKTEAEEADPQGEWSVAILWLTEPDTFSNWVSQIATMREETAYFEEVPVDILVNRFDNWEDACAAHGLPKLLLQTRLSLKRPNYEASIRWASADPQISDRLLRLSKNIGPELQAQSQRLIEHMKQLLRTREAGPNGSRNGEKSTPRPLYGIHISSFRNVEQLTIDFRRPDEVVEANIIQGPNGTGKSSIAEALSIAYCGVSGRYMKFLGDSNEPNQNKSAKYVGRYLTPINQRSSTGPMLGLNATEPRPVVLAEIPEAKERMTELSGTFFSQSWGESLLHMRAEELGAQIAGDYSSIASHLLDFMELQIKEAETARSSFNRSLGLRANISRDETAHLQIVSTELTGLFPEDPNTLSWLRTAAQIGTQRQSSFAELHSVWTAWAGRGPARGRELSQLHEVSEIEGRLRSWLEEYQAIVDKTKASIDREHDTRPSGSADEFVVKIRQWARWSRQIASSMPTTTTEVEDLNFQIRELQSTLSSLTATGTALRERLKQLDNAEKFVREHWSAEHADTCPICSSDMRPLGGIVTAISTTRLGTEKEIEEKRVDYRAARERLDKAIGRLSELDAATPPLAEDDVNQLRTILRKIVHTEFDLERLASVEVEQLAVAAIQFFATGFSTSLPSRNAAQIEQLASRHTQRIVSLLNRFAEVSEAPEAWKALQKIVFGELTETIREHLPKTIQALWWELARSIMPASWQYPGDITFDVASRRSQTEARLIVKGSSHPALAAHVLNDAELHNLGLAWFFARYLTFGRYLNSCLVLDDPAQQMDQPTFRDFCRLLETLVRLHKGRRIPLTLVVFLHEDGRALDAARATNATLHMLRWHHGTASLIRRMKLRIAPIAPRKPYRLFQMT